MQSKTSPRWVDVLFSRLAVRYGDAWFRKWDGLPIEDVKSDWERGLQHIFTRNPHAIAYALDHLPEFPPTIDAFSRQCLHAPNTGGQHLLPIKGNPPPPAIRELLEKLTKSLTGGAA